MSSSPSFVDYVLQQTAEAGAMTARKMFGEYGLYCGTKIVALICGDQLFVKPTEAGKARVSEIRLEPPYEGAKPYLRLDDELEDPDTASDLIRATAAELPEPKPKTRRKK